MACCFFSFSFSFSFPALFCIHQTRRMSLPTRRFYSPNSPPSSQKAGTVKPNAHRTKRVKIFTPKMWLVLCCERDVVAHLASPNSGVNEGGVQKRNCLKGKLSFGIDDCCIEMRSRELQRCGRWLASSKSLANV